MADLYRILGVGPEASRTEIARAYRREARAAHPDSKPDDPEALARFRAIAEAYAVLSDPVRRREYDHQHPPAPAPPRPPARPRASWPSGFLPWLEADEPPLRAGPVWIEPPADPGERP